MAPPIADCVRIIYAGADA